MHDYNLFIDSRSIGLGLSQKLNCIGKLFENNSVSIIWLLRERKITICKVIKMIRAEANLKNRNISINHSIDIGFNTRISKAALYLANKYGIKTIVHIPDYSFASEIKKRMNLKDSNCVFCDRFDFTDFYDWFSANNSIESLTFNDILKMHLKLHANQCKYNSCLGRTIYIKPNCELGICPYKQNTIKLNELSKCKSIDDLFDTNSFVFILKKHIEKRTECKSKCGYYVTCTGGCPFDRTCGESDALQILNSDVFCAMFDKYSNDATSSAFNERMKELSMKMRI